MTKIKNITTRYATIILLLLSVSLFPLYGLAGGVHDSILVKRCDDFKVSGTGDADAWKSTGWIKLIQRNNDTTGYDTRVKVLYSGTGIYFLFRCNDKKLTSTMKADNLNLWQEDVVEVFLWPDETFPVYFEYELSPMNYELPIMVPN